MHTAGPRRIRRSTALIGLVAAASIALAGCTGGGDAAEQDKTTIRFLYATGDETFNATVDALVDDFNATSTTTTVRPDPLPAGSDYATAMKTMDATGNWPAVVDMRDTATYVNAGKLAPIPAEVTDLLDPEAFAAADDGSVYVVPAGALNGEIGLNIVYNKDYFEENNLEVPSDYDEFIQLLEDIKANGDVPLATAAGEVWPSDQLWKQLAAPYFAEYSDAGGFWTAAEAGDVTVADLREPLEQLKYITDNFVLPGWQSTADAQTTTLLVNEQAVMATSSAGIGRLNDIHKVSPDFNAGLFIIPAEDGTINVVKNAVSGDTAIGLAISAQAAANEDEYASAVEFLQYFYSVDAANLMEENGSLAPNIKASADITRNTSIPGSEDYFALLENPKLNWIQNGTVNPNFGTFNTFFRQARIEMQDGQTTIDQAIEKTQNELNSVLRGQ